LIVRAQEVDTEILIEKEQTIQELRETVRAYPARYYRSQITPRQMVGSPGQ
jgi:hypothetical protein